LLEIALYLTVAAWTYLQAAHVAMVLLEIVPRMSFG
jgi:hypothetical protein